MKLYVAIGICISRHKLLERSRIRRLIGIACDDAFLSSLYGTYCSVRCSHHSPATCGLDRAVPQPARERVKVRVLEPCDVGTDRKVYHITHDSMTMYTTFTMNTQCLDLKFA